MAKTQNKNDSHEAMEKAERELLQGLGGYIVFLDEKDQEEYENVEESIYN